YFHHHTGCNARQWCQSASNLLGKTMQEFLDKLVATLGPNVVHTDAATIEPWLTDWRGVYKGSAQAVVRPVSTEQVSQCMRLCSQYKVPVVTRGGNTGLCGAATPDARCDNVILSLDRMNAIRAI